MKHDIFYQPRGEGVKHDIFEFTAEGMTPAQRAWRFAFLLACIAVTALDVFYWRP